MEKLTPGEMDEAADQALTDLTNLSAETVNTMADWWRKHYLRAGHKRLGRGLVQLSKQNER